MASNVDDSDQPLHKAVREHLSAGESDAEHIARCVEKHNPHLIGHMFAPLRDCIAEILARHQSDRWEKAFDALYRELASRTLLHHLDPLSAALNSQRIVEAQLRRRRNASFIVCSHAVEDPTSVASAIEEEQGEELTTIPWAQNAHVLRPKKWSALRDQMRKGNIYIQSPSSMLPPTLLLSGYDDTPCRVADVCASPGGKTVGLASVLAPGSTIIANDIDDRRSANLQQNLMTHGVTRAFDVHIEKEDAARSFLDAESLDGALCDVRCSGLASLGYSSNMWIFPSREDIGNFVDVQLEVLRSTIPAVRRKGRLVYSTYTSSPGENEKVVEQILLDYGDALRVVDPRELLTIEKDSPWSLRSGVRASRRIQSKVLDINPPVPTLRIDPSVYKKATGFFVAVFEKLR